MRPVEPEARSLGLDRDAGRRKAEGHDLDRQRKGAEPSDELGTVGNHHHPRRGMSHDLLAQKRAPTAFDQAKFVVDLVGAVDRQIKTRHLVERGHEQALALGSLARRLGSRHADDVRALRGPAPPADRRNAPLSTLSRAQASSPRTRARRHVPPQSAFGHLASEPACEAARGIIKLPVSSVGPIGRRSAIPDRGAAVGEIGESAKRWRM